ncbi:Lrp/AsnC family transcriptional regulator [Prosthecomicrobium pneumaticum]|uniref:Lrp/AsnC family transcriptional regulator n=2 Tax=Prosthecomicrobium pneumaticum TaxID=81895 RepID=A0A7W9FQU8_9HYPH|nr:Lrp/AsnC family transcriptional regulator [Prosthecomicrobium pneumaticum]
MPPYPRAMLDDRDRKLLDLLQADAETPIGTLADAVHLSISACSRRIARLKEEGYVARTVALVDRRRIGLPTTIFVLLRTSQHTADWLDDLRAVVADIPEIVEVHRLTGNVDYIMKIVLPNVEYYDVIYKAIVKRISLHDISAYISMETLKSDTAVPTRHLRGGAG